MTEKEIKWGRIEIRNPNPRADSETLINQFIWWRTKGSKRMPKDMIVI